MAAELKRAFIIFTAGIAAGYILLIAVYLLPVKPIREHIAESLQVFKDEGKYPFEYDSVSGTKRDNFTDALMLNIAATSVEGDGLRSAAANYYQFDGSNSPIKWLRKSLKSDDTEDAVSYARYWHGYLVFLKPLLSLFNYQQIRYINLYVQMTAIICVILLLYKKGKGMYIVPFLSALTFFPLTVTSKSLQFTTVFLLTMVNLILMMLFFDLLKAKHCFLICFMLFGMSVSYFDLLTYPVVNIGFATCFYWILASEQTARKVRNSIVHALAWLFGYAGMWVSKWIISGIVLKANVIADAVDSVKYRTSDFHKGVIHFRELLLRLFSQYPKLGMCVAVLCMCIFLLAVIFIKKMRLEKSRLCENAPLLVITLLPVIWVFCAKNHSDIHVWFVYRNISVMYLAIAFVLSSLWVSGNDTDKKTGG